MGKVFITEDNLIDIATAIREKTGKTEKIQPLNFANEIKNISNENGMSIEDILITRRGENIINEYTNNRITNLRDGAFSLYDQGSGIHWTIENINLPNVTKIGKYAFYLNRTIKSLNIPNAITLGERAFWYCHVPFLDLPKVTTIDSCCFYYSQLQTLVLSSANVVTLADTDTFFQSPIGNGTGYIYVPNNLIEDYKVATNWSVYADQIKSLNLQSIDIISPNCINMYNNNKTMNLAILYNGDQKFLYYPEEEGYTFSVNGNATVDNNILTLTDAAQAGDIITITATSTYDSSISSTKNIEVVYKEVSMALNLNDGQWIDSGQKVDGNIVYKSDQGSYNISSGKSTAILTVSGYTHIKLYIRSYAETTYDFTEAFSIDTTADRGKGLFSTKGNQSATKYIECVYELDGNQHTIEIMYSKDSSGNSYDDRGYFYIGEMY